MTDEQFLDGVLALKRARKAKRDYYWWFGPKGGDNDPVLLVGKKEAITRKEGREARKGAKDKKFAFGRLRPDSDGKLVFAVDEGNAKVNQISRAFKINLAKADGFKKVKAVLQRARILGREEFEKEFAGVPVDEEAAEEQAVLEGKKSFPTAHAWLHKIGAIRKRAMEARQGAVSRGTADAELGEVGPIGKAGSEALKKLMALQEEADESKYLDIAKAAFEAFTELTEAYAAMPEADIANDEVADKEIDFDAIWKDFLDAWDTVQDQLNKLSGELRKTDDPELQEIADKGLSQIAKGYRTNLQKHLFEARGATSHKRDQMLVHLADLAEEMRDELSQSPQVKVVDENPFGVKVSVNDTLGGGLDRIAGAIS